MFKHLETFFAVFEGRSFTKAAEKLYISQPTVSVHIRQLENELHMKLFERNGRSEIVPTPNGEKLYKKLLTMQTEWRKVIFDISQQQPDNSILRIATTELASVIFLPRILAFIQETLPSLTYKISILTSEQIASTLDNNHADLVLSEKKINHNNFKCSPIFTDELVLAGQESLDTWLLPTPTHSDYDFIQAYLRSNELFIDKTIVINDDFTRTQLIEHGLGKSIISKHVLAKDIKTISLDNTFTRQLYITHPTYMYDPLINSAIETIINAQIAVTTK